MTLALVPVKQSPPPTDPYEIFLAAMMLLYMRAPARKTAPGETVDLGEIGSAPEAPTWSKATPYSPARRRDV